MKSFINHHRFSIIYFGLIIGSYSLLLLFYLYTAQLGIIPKPGFDLASYNFKFYPFCIIWGSILALIGFEHYSLKNLRLTYAHYNSMIVLGTIIIIICARAWHIFTQLSFYRTNPREIFNLSLGGLSLWGALLGLVITLGIFYRFQLKAVILTLSYVSIFLPLVQSFGRWGNYFNNELFGVNHQPLFLYESCFDLALFIILFILQQKIKIKKQLLLGIYLISYGFIRLIIQPLRADINSIVITTLVAAVFCIVAGITIMLYYLT